MKDVVESVRHLSNYYTTLWLERDRLFRSPRADGSIYLRRGKYAYLIHSQRRGKKRVREYIGVDARKVQEAQRRIENNIKYVEVNRMLHSLSGALDEIDRITSKALKDSRRT